MFDMGPYYLTALVSLLGPAKTVCGITKTSFATRTITSEKKFGKVVDVEVPTHVAGTIEFASGAVATMITSFDVWHSTLPRIEIYGSLGTLIVPDPNTFGGPVLLRPAHSTEFQEIPLIYNYAGNSRGIGVADMARCIGTGDTRARTVSWRIMCSRSCMRSTPAQTLSAMRSWQPAASSRSCCRWVWLRDIWSS